MEIIKTHFDGILLVKPDVFTDERGYFYESFSKQKFLENKLEVNFLQDNVSKSRKDTVRGLHYQNGNKAQGKLCYVLFGKVLDVALDIRVDSPTFGKHFYTELSEENHYMIWIPVGFAHGFSVQSDEAIFKYKCTNYYSKENERTVLFNDPELNINWKVDKPIFSEKDLNGKSFKDSKNDFFFS